MSKHSTLQAIRMLLFIIPLCTAQRLGAQTFDWVTTLQGQGGNISPWNTAMDSAGFIYNFNFFGGLHPAIDLDPGPGTMILPPNDHIYVRKLDAQHNLVWARTWPFETSVFGGLGMSVDKNGNVYVFGTFTDTVDADPGPGILNLFPAAADNLFLLKLNSGGSLLWAGVIESYGGHNGLNHFVGMRDVAVDNAGNVYVTGIWSGTADMDPGPGIFMVTDTVQNPEDIFVSKLDPSGHFVWVRTFGSDATGFSSGDNVSYDIEVDPSGNVWSIGALAGTADIDPGPGIHLVERLNYFNDQYYIQKLDPNGNFLWGGGTGAILSKMVFNNGSVHISSLLAYQTSGTYGKIEIDPGPDTVYVNYSSADSMRSMILNLTESGDFEGATMLRGNRPVGGINFDKYGSMYLFGTFAGIVDFDPGPGVFNLAAQGGDGYITKFNPAGNFLWAIPISTLGMQAKNINIADNGDMYAAGVFLDTTDFDPGPGEYIVPPFSTSTQANVFLLKLKQKGVAGFVYNDINQNCTQDANEPGLEGRKVFINGINAVLTSASGYWQVDSLAAGTYTLAADSSGNWTNLCGTPQTFTVVNSDSFTIAPSIGMSSTAPCAVPNVSICTNRLRPCFSTAVVQVRACNQYASSAALNNAYVDVQLDTSITPFSSSMPYTSIGNHLYRFSVGTVYPGWCVSFYIQCSVSCNVLLHQTLCVEANIYPVDTCAFDTIPGDRSACSTAWDRSHLEVKGYCANDSIFFVVSNTEDRLGPVGDMTCASPVRIYVDGYLTMLSSVQLNAEDSVVYAFSADGRTWRLEADQHPLHPGNSHPNATVEVCGDTANWTHGYVNIFPPDDADPFVDIFCTETSASGDPNDKTGYPTGVGDDHAVLPNGQMEYLVRFQNTGNDTAFMVIVRDTLDEDLDIASVTPGAASHPYIFNMLYPRVLEWRFYDIQLPDSNENEPASHGYLTYTVNQDPNLANGTILNNAAAIYFDYNAPVMTNETVHTIDDGLQDQQWQENDTITVTSCGTYTLNGFTYAATGTYVQRLPVTGGQDKIITLNLTVNTNNSGNSDTTITTTACNSFTIDGHTYTSGGSFIHSLTNAAGCDSLVHLELAISHVDTSVSQTAHTLAANASGAAYQWINCDSGNPVAGETNAVFAPQADGNYAVVITTSECSSTSDCHFFLATGIDLLQAEDIRLFPQPARSQLSVVIPASFAGTNYSILEPAGKCMLTGTLTAGTTVVDIEKLSTGIYVFVVGNAARKKLVIFRD